MITFEQRQHEYAALWATASIRPENAREVKATARRIISEKPRYDEVSRATGVPWYVIGIIHSLECSLSFSTCLHNGDPLGKPTVRKPAGRGPFPTWEAAAIDALRYDKLDKVRDWSIERIAYMLETFNGFGYVPKRIPSPYLWSFTTAYSTGKWTEVWSESKRKYVSVFDRSLRSQQCGGMAILRMLLEIEPTQIDIAGAPAPKSETVGKGYPKAPMPTPSTQAGAAAKSTSVWMTLGSIAMSVVAAFKAATDWIAGLFGGAVDGAADAMQALPVIANDVETAVAPVRSLGGLIGANLGAIMHVVSLLMLVVVVARHVKLRREHERLKQVTGVTDDTIAPSTQAG